MFTYGQRSRAKLDTCHPELVAIAERALELSPHDFTIIHGWRGEDVQNALFDSGASKKRYPHSKHNHTDADGMPESLAIDFAPWIDGDIPWKDTHMFALIAGVFMAAANDVGVRLRYGADWDSDGSTLDHTFLDWGHMELRDV